MIAILITMAIRMVMDQCAEKQGVELIFVFDNQRLATFLSQRFGPDQDYDVTLRHKRAM